MSDWEKPFSLDAEVTIGLGGINKKTNKANPLKLEGYYLGFKEIPKKKGVGMDQIHFFQTASGMIGLWGKTHMNRELKKVVLGTMTRVTFTNKQQPTANGPMWLYDVVCKKNDRIEVEGVTQPSSIESAEQQTDEQYVAETTPSFDSDSGDEEESLFGDEEIADEPAPAPVRRPAQPVQAQSVERQKRVQALLAKR